MNCTSKKNAYYWRKLIKSACLEIVRLMLGPKKVKDVGKVPLSADTIKRRIEDMSNDIPETLRKKIEASPKFFIQIDETTDIIKKAQLFSEVRFVGGDSITEEY